MLSLSCFYFELWASSKAMMWEPVPEDNSAVSSQIGWEYRREKKLLLIAKKSRNTYSVFQTYGFQFLLANSLCKVISLNQGLVKLHTTMLKSLLMGLGTHSHADLILGKFVSIRFCFLLESDDIGKNKNT